MNGCGDCCQRFLSLITFGMLGSPAPAQSQSQLVASVSGNLNDPFPPENTPLPPEVKLTDRFIVPHHSSCVGGRQRSDTLETTFNLTG